MEKCIVEYDKKIEMFEKCIFGMFKIYESELYNNGVLKKNLSRERKEMLLDGQKALKRYIENKKFDYSLAFFVSLSLAKNYVALVENLKSGSLALPNLRNEEYWDKGEIDEDTSLFFAYSFINEIFGKILSIDMHKIFSSSGIHRAYLAQRSEILNK